MSLPIQEQWVPGEKLQLKEVPEEEEGAWSPPSRELRGRPAPGVS